MIRLWRLAPSSLCLSLCVSLLSACGGFGGLFEDPPPTLASLQPVSLPTEVQPVPTVTLQELAQSYRELLPQQQEATTRLQVNHRLADIEMLQAEQELTSANTDEAFFSGAITAYETLLRDNPDYPRKDQLLYQLSKAYSLNGDVDQSLAVLRRLSASEPDSPYLAEAYFRQAEGKFSESRYAAAEELYAQAISHGADTPYFSRGLYMQGWSRFKQDRYADAIPAFTASLDQLLPAGSTPDALPRSERELAQDTLRILAIVFARIDGTDTIAATCDALGPRPYEHLLYESLGDLYLAQERYDDSALAYQAFVERQPDSHYAHHFQLRVIEAYEAGGFDSLIVGAKENYVAAFAVDGAYWRDSDEPAQLAISEQLKLFIPELAGHFHALAQAARKAEAGSEDRAADTTGLYTRAAHYYQQYLDSFPTAPDVPRLTFLLAESRFEAGDYLAAIDAYEQVAYEYGEPAMAADAAYAAILGYEKLLTAQDDAAQDLQRLRIDSELRFQATFPADARATGVLAHAANALLQLGDYPAALAAATTLADLTPAPDDALLLTAWLVIGHSQFELEDYAPAEQAYRAGLDLFGATDQRREATRDRLAASIYRQGEQASELGEDKAAAAHYLRAVAAAPESEIRLNAQYDAAQALIRAGELAEANALLLAFRQRFPAHELTGSIGATLLGNYEQLEQWQLAAAELDRMRANGAGANPDPDFERQAHILAARYYDKAGNSERAVERYRGYARQWPEPLDDNLEAANRLTELYAEAGNKDQRRYWLEQIIVSHDGAGSAQSSRSLYLAAQSARELAGDAFGNFTSVQLSNPLQRSLPVKKTAMEQTIAAYNRCNRYAVEQFITHCTYRLALVYQQFSAELIASPRPPGLDALALEQYEIMLEEQAFPFEEQAIAIHESNARRCHEGIYDDWVQHSFTALSDLLPARYGKQEVTSTEQLAQIDVDSRTPRKLVKLNRAAIDLRTQGYFNGAEEAYLTSLAKDEDDVVTHHNIGILYDLYLGLPERAVYHYDRYQALTGGSDRRVTGWIADLARRQVSVVGETM